MTELWVNLRSGFGNLEPNERTALVALGIFMLMLLCYFTFTSAMSFYSNRLEERNRYVALVARMESTIDTARQNLGGTASTLSGQQILNQVSRTTRQFDIKPTRLQPEGSDGVSVWFDDVAFNDLMRWLDSQSRSGIGVKQMSVDREESAGTVNARVVLSGKSG